MDAVAEHIMAPSDRINRPVVIEGLRARAASAPDLTGRSAFPVTPP
jgi:hypothetical protein